MPTDVASARDLVVSLAIRYGFQVLGALVIVGVGLPLTHPRVLREPAPVIGVSEVGPLGVRLSIQPWVAVPDVVPVQAELYRARLDRFRGDRIAVMPAGRALSVMPAEEGSPWSS